MAKQLYKRIRAGRLVREVLWTPNLFPKSQTERAARQNVTTAARRRINLRKAYEQLTYLLAANFGSQDAVYTLTFDDTHLPADRTEARKLIKRFLAKLRSAKRQQGQELKYIYALEGRHGRKRLHFHIVMNVPEAEQAAVRKLWPYGYVHTQAIDIYCLKELAQYLTKEAREDGAQPGAHSWSGSRNLERPEVSPAQWVPDTVQIAPPVNAYILEREEKVNEYGRFSYAEYLLPELPPRRDFRPKTEYPPFVFTGSSV